MATLSICQKYQMSRTCRVCHESERASLVELDVRDLGGTGVGGEERRGEVVQEVPGLHQAVLPAGHDDPGPAGAPGPGRDLDCRLTGEDAAAPHILRADPQCSVARREEYLGEGRVPLDTAHRALVAHLVLA